MSVSSEFEYFQKKAATEGLGKPKKPLQWVFFTFVGDDGLFHSGWFIQSQDRISAAFDSIGVLADGITFNSSIEVPDDKMPPEEYRNRSLTLAEVRSFWPWVKA